MMALRFEVLTCVYLKGVLSRMAEILGFGHKINNVDRRKGCFSRVRANSSVCVTWRYACIVTVYGWIRRKYCLRFWYGRSKISVSV